MSPIKKSSNARAPKTKVGGTPCPNPFRTPEIARMFGVTEPQFVGDLPKSFLPANAAERKTYPIGTGFMDYFPDAVAAASHISHVGNQQHNPGQPLHWARSKSQDHADCIMRHFIGRGTLDSDGQRHSAKLLWRVAALLQQELEQELGLPLPRGCTEI